jgi:aspartyl protease family protein
MKWLVIIVGIFLALRCLGPSGPAARGNPHRVSVPSEPPRKTELTRESNGHFYTYAKVNGELVHFLVDTGATSVALTEEDAARVGIDVSPASFDIIGEGASGAVRGKLVTIDSVEVDGKLVNDVSGAVLEGSRLSLLGQSYLSRMGNVEMSGDYMVLR